MASIEKTLARYDSGNCYRWGIAQKEDDTLIGVIELLRFDEDTSTCSFAYMLGCDYWNQGYATEALSAVIRFAFEKMEIDRIMVDHMAPNAASGAVMRKVGMTHTGTEQGKYEKHGLMFDAECYEIRNNIRKAMTVNEYQQQAMALLNPALDKKDVLINGVMGLCGESGEAIDIVKKWLAQGHELDKEKLARELGDIAWYLAETAYALDIPLEDVFRGNIEKLAKRYPEGFRTYRSVNRE
jgi:RimJ/RimL family protein N-acetyltransferase/NTP pyrophosphatase (non-canonical NTP hydrolase)